MADTNVFDLFYHPPSGLPLLLDELDYYGSGGDYLEGGSPFSASNGSPGGMRRTDISNSLRPFTISQLTQATQAFADAEWRVDNVEVGQVTIVGQVFSISKQPTNCVYIVDDGIGRIEARHWVDTSGEDASKWGGMEENQYVRVTGGLKTFGKTYINVTHIREIKDPHEIYFHILEAIAANLIIECGPPPSPLASPNKSALNTNNGLSASSTINITSNLLDHRVLSARDILMRSAVVFSGYGHLPQLQQNIIRFISAQPHRDEGIHVAVIEQAIGASSDDAPKTSDALDSLMDPGHLFTTIDNSHFQLCF